MRFVQHGFPPVQGNPLPRAGGFAWLWQLCPKRPAQGQEIRPPDVRPRRLFENHAQGPTMPLAQAHALWCRRMPPLSSACLPPVQKRYVVSRLQICHLSIENEHMKVYISQDYCITCGLCREVCPVGAYTPSSRTFTTGLRWWPTSARAMAPACSTVQRRAHWCSTKGLHRPWVGRHYWMSTDRGWPATSRWDRVV